MISRDLRHAQNVGARHRWLNRLQTALLVLTLLGLVGVEVTAGGIVPGDRVISIDGIAVDDVTTLQARLDDKNVGRQDSRDACGTTTGSLMESGSWICTAKQPSDFSLAPNYEP
jgi:hypothetical protein